jgi:hypothetical protein
MTRTTIVVTLTLVALALLCRRDEAASSPAQAPAGTDVADMMIQFKELQRQVAAISDRTDGQSPRIVAAGTATWTRPEALSNRTSVRVQLPADVAAQLGKDFIVLLTNRFPQAGYPYFAAYWTPATGGFDVTLVEPTLPNGGVVSYANGNRTYLVDWIVVKK